MSTFTDVAIIAGNHLAERQRVHLLLPKAGLHCPKPTVVKPVVDPYKNLLKPDQRGGDSIVKKPWFWGVLGGVVAAGVTTAIIIATQDPEPSPNFKVDALVTP